MQLVPSFVELVQQVSFVMTAPTFASFVIVLAGWVFARRRTVTRMILAADAVDTKHPCAFHRVFAAARSGPITSSGLRSCSGCTSVNRRSPSGADAIARGRSWPCSCAACSAKPMKTAVFT